MKNQIYYKNKIFCPTLLGKLIKVKINYIPRPYKFTALSRTI